MAIERLEGYLREHTSLRVGGGAKQLVRVSTDQELIDLVLDLDRRSEPLLILGGGSNVVCADSEFPGTVIIVSTQGIEWLGDRVVVAAGEDWDEFVNYALEQGFGELTPLAGIPGSIGATPVQNIGAYGVELAEFVDHVDVLDRKSGVRRSLSATECEFEYRDSAFKKNPNRYVVLAVKFRLNKTLEIPIKYLQLANVMNQDVGTTANAVAVRDEVLQLRATKSMLLDSIDAESNSTGSFFVNPTVRDVDIPQDCPNYPLAVGDPRVKTHVKASAAWLIENAGITKGFHLGGEDSDIRVSRNHSLAITNTGQGSAQEVIKLASHIRQRVFSVFGIELIVEPVLINCELDQLGVN
jgi:UDP-N-acetylmuramate dehydrogenase